MGTDCYLQPTTMGEKELRDFEYAGLELEMREINQGGSPEGPLRPLLK